MTWNCLVSNMAVALCTPELTSRDYRRTAATEIFQRSDQCARRASEGFVRCAPWSCSSRVATFRMSFRSPIKLHYSRIQGFQKDSPLPAVPIASTNVSTSKVVVIDNYDRQKRKPMADGERSLSAAEARQWSAELSEMDVRRRVKMTVNRILRILRSTSTTLLRSSSKLLTPGSRTGNAGGLFDDQGWELFPRMQISKRNTIVFLANLAVATAMIVSNSGSFPQQSALALTQENLVFLEAWRIIDRAYVDKSFNGQSWFRYRENALREEPMKTRDETYAAIRKMLATLDDPFTRFLEPEKFKSLKSGANGALTGVGLEVGYDVSSNGNSDDLVVVAPILGGPAGRAGIVPGDVILAIDGVPARGMGLYDAARRLQGELNSQVELTVLSKSTTSSKTVNVSRELVTVNPVSWKLCDLSKADRGPAKVGYIRLSTFNQNSSRAVKTAIKSLQNNGATSFVLDIRNNSGGLFPAGVEIAKMWLENGVIVYITDNLGVRDIFETDGEGAIATKEPLTVLVNKGTASASEILAGALKDNKRATIVGETTFGKGRIQSIFQLSDGSGMAVTVARYETPAHTNIDKVGIIPDRPVAPEVLPMDDSLCNCFQDPLSPIYLPLLSP